MENIKFGCSIIIEPLYISSDKLDLMASQLLMLQILSNIHKKENKCKKPHPFSLFQKRKKKLPSTLLVSVL